jgi:dienelactone hydrolase
VLRRVRHDDPAHEYFAYVPTTAGAGAPLFVGVHGISRNAEEIAQRFSAQCEEFNVVLVAPYFSQGHSTDYQRLGRSGRGPRADAALHSILEEIAWLTGAETARIHLFGFSGGAQFVHRYVMAYPHRVTAAVVAAAGWYTLPDPRKRFPYGIRATRDLPGVRFDPEEFLRVPITVMVGEQDLSTADLRSTRRVDRQGQNRVERARNWAGAMQAVAQACRVEPRVSLEMIPGGAHSFTDLMERGQLGARVFAALFGASSLGAAGDGHG